MIKPIYITTTLQILDPSPFQGQRDLIAPLLSSDSLQWPTLITINDGGFPTDYHLLQPSLVAWLSRHINKMHEECLSDHSRQPAYNAVAARWNRIMRHTIRQCFTDDEIKHSVKLSQSNEKIEKPKRSPIFQFPTIASHYTAQVKVAAVVREELKIGDPPARIYRHALIGDVCHEFFPVGHCGTAQKLLEYVELQKSLGKKVPTEVSEYAKTLTIWIKEDLARPKLKPPPARSQGYPGKAVSANVQGRPASNRYGNTVRPRRP